MPAIRPNNEKAMAKTNIIPKKSISFPVGESELKNTVRFIIIDLPTKKKIKYLFWQI
jgi:hypothetical protein